MRLDAGNKQKAATRRSVTADCELRLFVRLQLLLIINGSRRRFV